MDPLNIVLLDIFCNMFNNLSMYHCMKWGRWGGSENLLFAILMKKGVKQNGKNGGAIPSTLFEFISAPAVTLQQW